MTINVVTSEKVYVRSRKGMREVDDHAVKKRTLVTAVIIAERIPDDAVFADINFFHRV